MGHGSERHVVLVCARWLRNLIRPLCSNCTTADTTRCSSSTPTSSCIACIRSYNVVRTLAHPSGEILSICPAMLVEVLTLTFRTRHASLTERSLQIVFGHPALPSGIGGPDGPYGIAAPHGPWRPERIATMRLVATRRGGRCDKHKPWRCSARAIHPLDQESKSYAKSVTLLEPQYSRGNQRDTRGVHGLQVMTI
jgi:hypothetical protein